MRTDTHHSYVSGMHPCSVAWLSGTLADFAIYMQCCFTLCAGVGVSTKGVVTVNGESEVSVYGNGRGDFLEECRIVLRRTLANGSGETNSSSGVLCGTICGVDASRVSNEMYGRVAPLTLDSRGGLLPGSQRGVACSSPSISHGA